MATTGSWNLYAQVKKERVKVHISGLVLADISFAPTAYTNSIEKRLWGY